MRIVISARASAGSPPSDPGDMLALEEYRMSVLLKIFGPGGSYRGGVPSPDTCAHSRLMPRYRNHDALEAGRPMGYKCQRCYAEFLPDNPTVTRWKQRQAAAQPVVAESHDAA